MDFPDRLALVLKESTEGSFSHEVFLHWNEEIESFLSAPPAPRKPSSQETKEESTKDTIEKVAIELHKGILGAIQGTGTFVDDASETKVEEVTRLVTDRYRDTHEEASSERLFEWIRASKNLLRWFIQIFLERKGRILSSPVRSLQSPAILELLVSILEHNHCDNQGLARNISLYIFYATYIPFPGDETSQKALNHVISNLSFTELALRILIKPCTSALALSLVRNVHNAIVSLQGAAKLVLSTKLAWDHSSASDAAAWAPKESGNITFRSMCVCLIRWAVASDPPFPGEEEDKRAELAIEILGAFYALRAGQELVPSRCDPALMRLVVDVLKLPSKKDKRIDQCKLSTISLLMDSDRTFGNYLLKEDAITPLLAILEGQVTDVLENTRVDNSSTADLVPILVVLNKFACANSELRQQIKLLVFPAEAEEHFQQKAQEQRELDGSKKNMAPLDAPKGTLRWKLTCLLTWPEGHIKRCTGELLWTVCSSDAGEFVHRVGFGNALPILSVKGFAQMPVQL